jgi:hypothetical protein
MALYSYLFDQENLSVISQEIQENLPHHDYMYSRSSTLGNWLTSKHTNYNIRRLMTNAGFYSSGDMNSFLSDFNNWGDLYLSALKQSNNLFLYPGAYPNYLMIERNIFSTTGIITDYKTFPSPTVFYRLLEGHDICFVTPFNKQIEELYNSRDILHLYKDISIPEFSMRTIPAFISTYPNSPHAGWSDTFNTLKDLIDQAYRKRRFSLFFAASGCYGLPLCSYVNKQYGVPSVYNGNLLNTLFGISQKSNIDFMKDRKNLDKWRASDLDKVKNMKLIDGGRYT